jgi:trimethylamine corrinoid protein
VALSEEDVFLSRAAALRGKGESALNPRRRIEAMEKEHILQGLATAVVDGDEEKAIESAREAVGNRIDPLEAVEKGLSKGMAVVGAEFESGDAFLPELLMAAEAFNAAMEILNPEIEAQRKQVTKLGTVLMSTVKGDVHNIGKNIVSTVLGINGFEVVDIGIDNSSLDIIQEAQKARADVIALSSLMTTTMPAQREVIEVLVEMNVRDRFLVMVGGGPVTEEWAEEIGADGYGRSAIQAVETARRLMEQKRQS